MKDTEKGSYFGKRFVSEKLRPPLAVLPFLADAAELLVALVQVGRAAAEPVGHGLGVAHVVQVPEGAEQLAAAAVVVGPAEAVAVLVVAQRRAVGLAGAALQALVAEEAGVARGAVAGDVVAAVAGGAVAALRALRAEVVVVALVLALLPGPAGQAEALAGVRLAATVVHAWTLLRTV